MNLVRKYINKQCVFLKSDKELYIIFKNGSEIRTVPTDEPNKSVSSRR